MLGFEASKEFQTILIGQTWDYIKDCSNFDPSLYFLHPGDDNRPYYDVFATKNMYKKEKWQLTLSWNPNLDRDV